MSKTVTKRKSVRGRKLGSGKYEERLPGISVSKETFELIERLAELMSNSLTGAARVILENEVRNYLKKFQKDDSAPAIKSS